MTEPTPAASAIVQRIWEDPSPRVTAGDAAVLEASPARTLMMEKLLAIHYAQTGNQAKALRTAQAIFAAEPAPENAKNVALLLRRLKRFDEGIAFCRQHEDRFHPIDWHDAMTMLMNESGDREGAARHGTKSLELKDAACQPAPPITPRVGPIDLEAPRRNVIAFSLWGQDPRYLTGAMKNAVVARHLYPGWTARFYIDESVPQACRDYVLQQGAQIAMAPTNWPADRYGLFWRFLVEDDETVDIYIVRDADSVMNIKERVAVEDWLASGRAFHVMRDLPTHSELILAGMWGAHRGNIGNMAERVRDHVTGGDKKLGNRITDQEFLRWKIWPIVRQDVLAHDSHLDFGDPVRFRDEFRLPSIYHVGQNDFIHRRVRQPAGGAGNAA